MRKISFTPRAYTDYIQWIEIDRKLFTKISGLIIESAKNPFNGLGKPEPLKHSLKGYWSRRIDDEHRLVYKVADDAIEIISCRYHYI